MSPHLHQCLAIACAILAFSGAAACHASLITYTNANCTSFVLGGVAPNQTLNCVGGGVGGNPASVALNDMNCSSYTLTGAAPNQVLICNVAASSGPSLLFAVSRKTQGAAGTFNLPLSLAPAGQSAAP